MQEQEKEEPVFGEENLRMNLANIWKYVDETKQNKKKSSPVQIRHWLQVVCCCFWAAQRQGGGGDGK